MLLRFALSGLVILGGAALAAADGPLIPPAPSTRDGAIPPAPSSTPLSPVPNLPAEAVPEIRPVPEYPAAMPPGSSSPLPVPALNSQTQGFSPLETAPPATTSLPYAQPLGPSLQLQPMQGSGGYLPVQASPVNPYLPAGAPVAPQAPYIPGDPALGPLGGPMSSGMFPGMGMGLHARYPYYSYRRPWYTPGPASLNVNIIW